MSYPQAPGNVLKIQNPSREVNCFVLDMWLQGNSGRIFPDLGEPDRAEGIATTGPRNPIPVFMHKLIHSVFPDGQGK